MTDAGSSLFASVKELGEQLDDLVFHLEVPGVDPARAEVRAVAGQIDDYLLPRLERLDAPLLVVVGGSTGAGKSTLVNSIIGRTLSPAGVLRPTTTTPVIAANPEDLTWFGERRILPDLPRLTGEPRQGDHGVYLVGDDDVPPGLALLDAPDVDSVVEANRLLSSQLLAAADLWLFTTTAARYADAVPWDLLRTARERSAAVAIVLNRVPHDALAEVPMHLAEMLERERLGDVVVLTIPEVELGNGLIPTQALRPLREWLDALAADTERRSRVIRTTLDGALLSLPVRVAAIAQHLDLQTSSAEQLVDEVRRAYDVAMRDVEDALSSPGILRGEVLARWHEFIGTADLMRSIQSTIGRVRDRIGGALTGRPPLEAEVRSAVESNIEVAVIAACDKAVDRVRDGWRSAPYGRVLLEGPFPSGSSEELRESIDSEVREWQGYVLELVAQEGRNKRAVGRAASIGVNALGAALMVAIFAQTGGLTGGEIAVAGGTAAVSQRLLEALFGDQAVRDLTSKARLDLLKRLERLVTAEAARFETPARASAPPAHAASDLRSAVAAVAAVVAGEI